MGLGGATKKLQMVADMGEELYDRINELREQIVDVRETVDETNRRVAAVENKLDGQAAILEALAEEQGIDVEAVLTDVAIEEAEGEDEDENAIEATIPDADSEPACADSDSGSDSA
jgi:uncharacterized coiled-coil DUF342 family protein